MAAHLCFYTGKWLGHLCTLDSTCDSSVPTCVISGPPPVQPSLLTPASGIKLVHQGLCLAGDVPQIGFALPKTSFPCIMVALTKQKSESKIYSFEQLFLLDLSHPKPKFPHPFFKGISIVIKSCETKIGCFSSGCDLKSRFSKISIYFHHFNQSIAGGGRTLT